MEPDQTPQTKQADPRAALWSQRHQKLKADRAPWDSQWQEIANFALPGKANIQDYTLYPNDSRETQLFTTVPHDSALTCAAGLLSWTTGGRWFVWEPALALRGSDEVKQWMQACSEAGHRNLANSNFITERHEDLLNHVAFGTSCLYVTLGDDGKTLFKSLKIGSFCIVNNHEGKVDTIYRELPMTALQIEQEFGRDSLPENIAKCLEGEGKERDKLFTVIQVVEPRRKGDYHEGAGKAPAKRKRFCDVYFEKESKCILREGGHDRFPFFPGRYMNWETADGTSVWGIGPGFAMLPDARQLNFLRKMIAVLLEKSAFPPYMVPDSWEGQLDVSARAANFYAQGQGEDKIYPLNVTGDPKFAQAEAEVEQRAIEGKFHVPFFQLFSELSQKTGEPVTATQVNEMAGERLAQIEPAYSRLTSEKDSPMLEYLFELWMEAGMLPKPPPEAVLQDDQGAFTLSPVVAYISRLALAIKAMENSAFDRSFARIMAYAQVKPDILDNIDDMAMTRDSMRNDGVPASWIRPMQAVKQIRDERAQAAAQAAQMQALQQGTEAAKNIGQAAPGLQQLAA